VKFSEAYNILIVVEIGFFRLLGLID